MLGSDINIQLKVAAGKEDEITNRLQNATLKNTEAHYWSTRRKSDFNSSRWNGK